MPDVIILWDGPLFFEHMFEEYEISSTVAAPSSLNSPHLPPAKLLIVPAGFTYPEHAAVSGALEDKKIQKKIFDFVENGGVFLMFSPLKEVSTCSACRVPAVTPLARFGLAGGLAAEYVQTDVLLRRGSLLTGDADSVYCDGYFRNIGSDFVVIEQADENEADETDENKISEANNNKIKTCKTDEKRPVHIAAGFGKGQIILSSVHEFLSKTYFDSLLTGPKVKL